MTLANNQLTLLQLAAAQLALSMKETEQPFDDLSKLFVEIVEGYNEIGGLLESDEPEDRAKIRVLYGQSNDRVRKAVVDFQFYDRMTQRLQHIMGNIQDAINVMSLADKNDADQWESIFTSIEQSYTMREETELFRAIRDGVGFEEAVKNLIEQTYNKDAVEPDIELF